MSTHSVIYVQVHLLDILTTTSDCLIQSPLSWSSLRSHLRYSRFIYPLGIPYHVSSVHILCILWANLHSSIFHACPYHLSISWPIQLSHPVQFESVIWQIVSFHILSYFITPHTDLKHLISMLPHDLHLLHSTPGFIPIQNCRRNSCFMHFFMASIVILLFLHITTSSPPSYVFPFSHSVISLFAHSSILCIGMYEHIYLSHSTCSIFSPFRSAYTSCPHFWIISLACSWICLLITFFPSSPHQAHLLFSVTSLIYGRFVLILLTFSFTSFITPIIYWENS